MDIFTALQTAVTGLQAQSYAISNISGNIANSQTTGFKRIDSSFVDLLSEQSPKHEVAGTVVAQSRLTNTLQGNIIATKVPTNMALNGDGFFVVQSTQVSGSSSNTNLFTRRGDFALDKSGHLVNGSGGVLQDINVDKVTGAVTSNGPITIKTTTQATATTSISYGGNLPVSPGSTTSSASTSLLYSPTATPSPVVLTGTGTGTVPADTGTTTDASTFYSNSIAGPSLTMYDTEGNAVPLQTRWAKVADATGTPPAGATWNLFYANTSGVDAGKTDWTNVGDAFVFDKDGKLPTTMTGFTIEAPTINGKTLTDITVKLDGDGLTQTGTTGSAVTDTLAQNGSPAGTLNDVSITAEGKIVGTYSNGLTTEVGTVPIVKFVNPDGLKPQSGGNYSYTLDAGAATKDLGNTVILGSNVEQSNTDIADEFSKMIVTQQAYSANTRVMSTAQQMMSDLLNVIR
ncbi:flagellar hook protein FlgE [Methylobacterium sp. A54F]